MVVLNQKLAGCWWLNFDNHVFFGMFFDLTLFVGCDMLWLDWDPSSFEGRIGTASQISFVARRGAQRLFATSAQCRRKTAPHPLRKGVPLPRYNVARADEQPRKHWMSASFWRLEKVTNYIPDMCSSACLSWPILQWHLQMTVQSLGGCRHDIERTCVRRGHQETRHEVGDTSVSVPVVTVVNVVNVYVMYVPKLRAATVAWPRSFGSTARVCDQRAARWTSWRGASTP